MANCEREMICATYQKHFGIKKTYPHKFWRSFVKKMKRKKRRQCEAQKRDTLQATSERDKRPEECEKFNKQQQLVQELDEKERENQHCLWLLREKQSQIEFQRQKQWEEKEKQRREQEEVRFRKEIEEREKKEQENEEKRKKEEEHKESVKKAQENLLKEATKNERVNSGDNDWHNPIAPIGQTVEREKCTFYMKVGACRFGDRCTRDHPIPDSSTTIMIPGFYTHFLFDQGLRDEFDSDLGLEYEESDQYHDFLKFYEDVLPEFKAHGKVVQFKVCANFEPHLRGNVYVQFSTEEEAYSILSKFNGRWYAGKQLNCQLCVVETWRRAICGEYNKKRCPKGKTCNFIHAFKNPNNEYLQADRDYQPSPYQSHRSSRSPDHRRRYRRRLRSRTPERWRSTSRSPSPRRNKKRRKESRERSHSPRNKGRSPGATSYKSVASARSSDSPGYLRSRSRRSPSSQDSSRSYRTRRPSRSPDHVRSKWSRSGSSERKRSRSPDAKKNGRNRNSSHKSNKRSRSCEKETSLLREKPTEKIDEAVAKEAEDHRMSWAEYRKANAEPGQGLAVAKKKKKKGRISTKKAELQEADAVTPNKPKH